MAAQSILEVREAALTSLIADDAAFEQLGTGFIFTEGPVWHPVRQTITFSDMPGDVMRQWSAARGIEVVRQPCSKSNGLAYDREGRLLACEHATSRVTRTEASGQLTTLASHHGDKELNSPNDIIVGGDGAIYFSDPTYGRMEHYGLPRPQQLDFQGVYRIDPASGAVQLLARDFGQPNGLCFSLDGRALYVNDTDRGHIRKFAVRPDGTLDGGGVWAETKGGGPGAPDGMKIDSLGNIWCCGPGGIHVFDASARCLGVVRTPEYVANFCWGGADYRSLFVTASTSLYRIRTQVAGRPLF